jgi:hypothetical protein
MNDHDFHTGEANYDNQNVQLQRAQLGAFVYNSHSHEHTLGNREERDTQMLENGAKFKGEWLVNTEVR